MPSSTAFDSLPVRKRDRDSTRTGQSAKRSRKLLVCCSASSVVGTSTATCLPACAAMKAARMATSVLPKPTSPHTTRSMGFSLARSCSTWRMASAWSAVSSNGKAARERLVFQLALRQGRAALRLALRVQVEQLGGDVADLVGGALARLRPLVGAELVQRRAFGRGAGIARDQVQLLHRHVELVAAGVFEHHELAVLPGDLHDLQADVAADAVFFVDHRRTRARAP